MNTLFIHTNYKQILGAKLGKYSFEKEAGGNRNFEVRLLVAEELPEMQAFVGKTFITGGGRLRTYSFDDLQSFTLTRFKIPELMGYQGRAIVIDPDIFALQSGNIEGLFNIDMGDNAIAACKRERGGAWESSVMVLDCAKLKHWNLKSILEKLENRTMGQDDLMLLKDENVKQIPWIWNSMDKIESDSKILHTTQRITQPWRTGLPIDFTQKPMPKILGIIPREPIYKLLGRYPTHYLPHKDNKVVDFFFSMVKGALEDGGITEDEMRKEVELGHVRKDIFEVLRKY